VKKSRRQIINRIFEIIGIALVLLDLVVFFALYQPLRSKLDAVEREQETLRQSVRNQQVRVDILKKYEAAFPPMGKGLQDLTTNRTPSRREAYSTAAHLVHKIADAAGVKVASIGYILDRTVHNDPLERLELNITLEGPYTGLVKFSHALETANDFILVREFTFTPEGDNQALGLRLGADLYLTP
jgi:Tfp pilus assembly protein PilO